MTIQAKFVEIIMKTEINFIIPSVKSFGEAFGEARLPLGKTETFEQLATDGKRGQKWFVLLIGEAN